MKRSDVIFYIKCCLYNPIVYVENAEDNGYETTEPVLSVEQIKELEEKAENILATLDGLGILLQLQED
jgi:hypothetical protein